MVWGGLGQAPPGTADEDEMICEKVKGPGVGTGPGTATWPGESVWVGIRAVVGKGRWGAHPAPRGAEPLPVQAGT